MKKSFIQIQQKNILKGDIPKQDFIYIQDIIESVITQDMIDQRKIPAISNAINDAASDVFKQEYIIISGIELSYYLQYKHKFILIMGFGKVSIIVFKPRQLDIPRILKLENFDDDINNQVQNCINCVKIIQKVGNFQDEDQQWINQVIQHIIQYFIKYKQSFIENQSQFETDFITKLRNFIVVAQKDFYWQIILSQKHCLITQQQESDKLIEFDLNFNEIIPQQKQILKLLIFQKKGKDITISENIASRKQELIGFIGLLLLFICLVMCKGYIDPSNHDELTPFNKSNENYKSHLVRDYICTNKQYILYGLSGLFISMVFKRILERYQKKAQKKQEKQKEQYVQKNVTQKQKQRKTKKKIN